jgi:hypothetical protein
MLVAEQGCVPQQRRRGPKQGLTSRPILEPPSTGCVFWNKTTANQFKFKNSSSQSDSINLAYGSVVPHNQPCSHATQRLIFLGAARHTRNEKFESSSSMFSKLPTHTKVCSESAPNQIITRKGCGPHPVVCRRAQNHQTPPPPPHRTDQTAKKSRGKSVHPHLCRCVNITPAAVAGHGHGHGHGRRKVQ